MKPKRADLEKAVAVLVRAIQTFVCPVCCGTGYTTRICNNGTVHTHCECCFDLKESLRKVYVKA